MECFNIKLWMCESHPSRSMKLPFLQGATCSCVTPHSTYLRAAGHDLAKVHMPERACCRRQTMPASRAFLSWRSGCFAALPSRCPPLTYVSTDVSIVLRWSLCCLRKEKGEMRKRCDLSVCLLFQYFPIALSSLR